MNKTWLMARRRRSASGNIVAGAAFFILFAVFGTLYSYGVFFKSVMNEFAWSRELTSGAYSVGFFMSGVGSVIAGRLTDRFGSRLLASACGVLMGSGFLLMPLVSKA